LLDLIPDGGPTVLLEPTAGQGESLCATDADLADYFTALDDHPMLGVCLDTCHAFAAGHDLATRGGMAATLTSS
jgi:deoxyribonuclease-4